jgi:hypothetical protein
MTYNFDPDRWFENEMAWLEGQRKAGKLSARAFRQEADALEKRCATMWQRLDGTYRIRADAVADTADPPEKV